MRSEVHRLEMLDILLPLTSIATSSTHQRREESQFPDGPHNYYYQLLTLPT